MNSTNNISKATGVHRLMNEEIPYTFFFENTKITLQEVERLSFSIQMAYYHNTEGPAYISEEEVIYYHNGKKHNLKGPAWIITKCEPNIKTYYIDDNEYSFDEWLKKSTLPDEEKIVLKLEHVEDDVW